MKKWLKTKVEFESPDPETTAALITGIFQDFGMQGVIIETPEADPDLDWAEDVLPVEDNYAVIGFFPAHLQDELHRHKFEELVRSLHPIDFWQFKILYSDIDEEDWAESWKAHFHPVRITENIVIKPTWQPFEAKGDETIIEIDPGMAFGTGTHPTTALCIRLIKRHIQPEMRFLDIGTGSGILMIAASRLGAGRVSGIDCDPVAIEVAKGNLELNGLAPGGFDLVTGNLTEHAVGIYDMIAANILAETITELIPDTPPFLADKGLFIASGIIVEKEPMVTRTLFDHGMEILEKEVMEGWVAIVAKKT